jgi:hypothetical protein
MRYSLMLCLLLSTATATAAVGSRERDKIDPALKQCLARCNAEKGAAAQEACMIKCNESHPAQSTTKPPVTQKR